MTKTKPTHATAQVLGTWSAVVGIALFFLALLFSGFIPMPPPSLTQEQIVTTYQQDNTKIRIGMSLIMFSALFLIPIVGVISVQLKRIEGATAVMANTQLVAGALNLVWFFITGFFFLITAFRPDRPPELTYLMNDCAWFALVLIWQPAFAQNLSIGFAILGDKSEHPIFPRWVAYLNFWISLIFVPASLMPFFKAGPFAWNGILAFWLPATVFGIWFMVMVPMLLKAIKRQELEA